MTDLDTQIRTYFEEIDPPFDPQDLMRETQVVELLTTARITARRPVLAFALAFVLVLFVGAAIVLLGGPEAPDPAAPVIEPTETTFATEDSLTEPTQPTTGTANFESSPPRVADAYEEIWAIEVGPSALAAVEVFYEALNSGDLEAAKALIAGQPVGPNLDERLPIAVHGLGSQFDHDCVVQNQTVKCVETVTDDLYGPAGITNSGTVYYQFRNEKLFITDQSGQGFFVCSGDPTGDSLEYLLDLRVWAAQNHPELERYWKWGEPIDSALAIPCTPYPFPTPEAAQEISKAVSEFVAQSSRWPTERP